MVKHLWNLADLFLNDRAFIHMGLRSEGGGCLAWGENMIDAGEVKKYFPSVKFLHCLKNSSKPMEEMLFSWALY